nr:MAG TPA: hypothetical protein [Caudoviricetes sp.]
MKGTSTQKVPEEDFAPEGVLSRKVIKPYINYRRCIY